MPLQLIGLSIVYVGLVIAGQVFYKKAASVIDTTSIRAFLGTLFSNGHLYVGTILYVAALIVWIWMLKQVALSRIFPIMSAILLITIPLASQHFLEEVLSLRYWGGVLLIMGGIALIASEMTMFEG